MTGPAGVRRGAIIGFGNVAERAHLPAWNACEAFRIEAVVEPSPARAAQARALLPQARIHSRPEALFDSDSFDFVDICTPPCDHARLIVEACRAGLDVFCEKPLVPTLGELERVERAAADGGRVVFTVNNWKHAPIWKAVAALVADGAVGSVEDISLTVLRPPDSGGGNTSWRKQPEISGGGILLDHGWHHLYLTASLAGGRPTVARAEMVYVGVGDGRYEDTVDLHLRFPTARAHIHLTWGADRRANFGIIEGSAGRITIGDDHAVLSIDGAPPRHLAFDEALSAGSHHASWMHPVVEAFERELTHAGERGRNLEEAALCARLIDSAYRASRENAARDARVA